MPKQGSKRKKTRTHVEDEKAEEEGVCQEELDGTGVPLMVGTGTINPHSVIKMNEQALQFGADSCLVVTPYYTKPTQRGLREFFTMVADATPLPMLLYNVPGRTAVDLKPETVAELSRHLLRAPPLHVRFVELLLQLEPLHQWKRHDTFVLMLCVQQEVVRAAP